MTDIVKKSARRIEMNYALVQGFYWSSACTLGGFAAVFLGSRGLSNAQTGLAVALISILTIVLQLLLSDFSDRHRELPLKRTISAIYTIVIALSAAMSFFSLSAALLIAVYVVASALSNSQSGLLNAQLMQYRNVGIPASYGWPRGIGSVFYAVSAYFYGLAVERYSAGVLLRLYIVFAVLAMVSVLTMADPDGLARSLGTHSDEAARGRSVSYLHMLLHNPTLVLYLVVLIVSAVGQAAGNTFLIRVIEAAGGGTREFGLAIFIQAGVELPVMCAASRILSYFKAKHVLAFSFFCFCLRMLLLSQAASLPMIYAIASLNLVCFGLYGFATVFFVNSLVPDGQAVRAQSLATLCYTGGIGGILGNVLAGNLLDRFGLRVPMLIGAGICLVAALLMLVCCRVHTKRFD